MELFVDALVIEPKSEFRESIRNALQFENNVRRLHYSETLEQGLKCLSQNERLDVIFLSHRFRQPTLCTFLEMAKKTAAGRDAAYIQTVPKSSLESAAISSILPDGIDGFLSEPFSISSTQETINLALSNKKAVLEKKSKNLISVILKDLAQDIDHLAHVRSQGTQLVSFSRTVKDACRILRNLTGTNLVQYGELLADIFIKLELPQEAPNPSQRNSGRSLEKNRTSPRPQSARPLPHPTTSKEAYIAFLNHPNPMLRAGAIRKLARIKCDAHEVVVSLKECLNDSDGLCRRRAALALLEIGTSEALDFALGYQGSNSIMQR